MTAKACPRDKPTKRNARIISTIEEIRQQIPAVALDSAESMMGFIDNSEHDFLLDKLGQRLYDALCDLYATNAISTTPPFAPTDYYAQLLSIAQRVVVFDAFGRAVQVQAISFNGAGLNVATADDYPKVDAQAVAGFRATCTREAHAAVNRLLQQLELWVKQYEGMAEDERPEDLANIVAYWRESRYYFLSAQLLIPTAQVLQEYMNIYESREKFIQMLPDLRYVQEEIIATSIGEELVEALATVAVNGTGDPLLARVIHRLRKAMAAYLEERTHVVQVPDARRLVAHDEGVRHVERAIDMLVNAQDTLTSGEAYASMVDAVKASPLYRAPDVTPTPPAFENNRPGNVFFVTPPIG